jgi:DNA-binding NarL/FixJ family response regulator
MRNHISLLIVEPHSSLRRIIGRFLAEQAAPSLIVAGATSNLSAALQLAAVCQPRVVLIGLDHNIPAALQLIAELRAMEPAVGIIVIAPLAIAEYRQVVLAAGADRMLGREALHRELIPTIVQLVAGPSSAAQHAPAT